jgi:hypothetical protein
MTRVDFGELNRKQLVITLLTVVLVMFAEIMFIRQIKSVKEEIRSAEQENKQMERVFLIKTDAVSKYKSAFDIENVASIVEVESATKFYSILINVLSTSGFEEASVVKTSETKENVSFSVRGEAGYFSLLELLSSFRQSSYPIRLTNLELTGQTDGYVGYSYMIECRISDPELQRQKEQTTEKAKLQ